MIGDKMRVWEGCKGLGSGIWCLILYGYKEMDKYKIDFWIFGGLINIIIEMEYFKEVGLNRKMLILIM